MLLMIRAYWVWICFIMSMNHLKADDSNKAWLNYTQFLTCIYLFIGSFTFAPYIFAKQRFSIHMEYGSAYVIYWPLRNHIKSTANHVNYSLSQNIHAAHLATFNEITHTCLESAIEINERENFQKIFIDTFSFFTWKSLQEQKQISYGEL